MGEVKRFAALAVLIWGTVFIAMAAGGDLPAMLPAGEAEIATLIETNPDGQRVTVIGTIMEVQKDYVSDKGNTYQRAIIDDGTGEILLFCSTYTGRKALSAGQQVSVTGTYQLFYDTPEIFAECSDIEVAENVTETQ